jgi:hypothetical protein
MTVLKYPLLLLTMLCLPCLRLSAQAAYDGYDKVTLYDSIRVHVEESGMSLVTEHCQYRILTLSGARDYNTVKADYDPLTAFAEIRQAVVRRHNGVIDTFDNAEFDYPAPARMIYWGARQKMVALGRLEPGDTVEFTTFRKGFTYALLHNGSDDDKYIPPMRGHFYDIVPFYSNQPVMRKVYQIDIPTAKNLRYAVYNGQVESRREENGTYTLFTFTKEGIIPLQKPRFTLADNDIQTKLILTTTATWQEKSKWFYQVNEDYGSFTPTEEAKAKVNEMLRRARSENDSIAILTHWVADNMRYSGISMGEGEGYTLHRCGMNFTDRCGVCKDKAGLLIAMLRAAGFEAYAAMTMAGERIEDLPADQFNHCVAVVKRRNGNYQLLDPTWVPGVRELWSSAEQQQHFLMGLPDGATLRCTPVSKAENHYLKMTARTKVTRDGSLKGAVTVTAEGQSDRTVRYLFSGNRTQRKADVAYQFCKLYPNATLHAVRYSDEDRYLEHPVSITYRFTIPGYATVSDKELIVTPLLAKGFMTFTMRQLHYDETAETRQYPFQDACSRYVQLSETMSLPYGYTSASIPRDRAFNEAAATFDGGYKLENSRLTFNEKIWLKKRVYEASDWPSYRKAVANQRFFMNTPVVLSK